jgi:NADH:ubiquinone oxidoreductase subunit K
MMDYVILSIVLLGIGIVGLLTNRNLFKVFVSVELIATAATMNFVLLASSMSVEVGQAFMVLAFATDTCVSAIILALLVVVSRKYGTNDVGELLRKYQADEKLEVDE